MLDIDSIRKNPEEVKKKIATKNIDPGLVEKVLLADRKRREIQQEAELLRAERNKQAQKGKKTKKAVEVKKRLKLVEEGLKKADEEFNQLMLKLPNPPASGVPVGKDESGNQFVRKWGEPRPASGWDFKTRDHLKLGELLDVIDVRRAARVSGSRFGFLKREGALLEFALIRLALDTLVKEGFIPVIPPVFISDDSMRGMGYLEHGGEEETYHFAKDGLYLIGTSEQAVGPMHQDEIFEAKDLPRRYVAFSTCFRREAGSYGKDTRGIFRVHQFDKVEMFSFTKPDQSDKEHEYLLSLEEKLVQALEIPYQVVKMCTGDLGVPAARKYDIQCWFPGEGRYRETHSTSTCTDFQARRLNIKYRKAGKTDFVHTLNGTAYAIGRTVLAILENYQQKDGSVKIPEALQKYMGIEKISPIK